ncbi:unnamed protein product [Rotaria sp. Silwood1]|nr:unnamed protein product [Rotaria sp. Silwood1]CAF1459731.1 unnamed protein product [Rotaria sp. Silwood1]CAF4801161.1 unnamed protein product [Rotaria sp. Silwood1]CAF5020824.1 unnamed protein product [Rotaria sp. Silwood1]
MAAAVASSVGAAISSIITLMRKQSFCNNFVPLMDYNQEDSTGVLSFISTCMNTPKKFEYHPFLQYTIFIIDIICAIILTIEAVAKMKIRGILIDNSFYLHDLSNHFDAIMVLNIYFSIILQMFEIIGIINKYSYLTIIRSPPPFILIQVLKTFLKFKLSKSQIKSILHNVTQPDLMIPDTYCSSTKDGFHCPENFTCKKIEIQRNFRSYNANQEGWVFLMYRASVSLPSWPAFFYFITLIFFLVWLVKNVFIIVIIETFAEISVQFQQM